MCQRVALQADQTYSYDPYGELQTMESGLSDDDMANPFRFEGFYYDAGVKT